MNRPRHTQGCRVDRRRRRRRMQLVPRRFRTAEYHPQCWLEFIRHARYRNNFRRSLYGYSYEANRETSCSRNASTGNDACKVKYSFRQNACSGSRVVPCGRTDMTKLIVVFRNFANAPTSKALLAPKCYYVLEGVGALSSHFNLQDVMKDKRCFGALP